MSERSTKKSLLRWLTLYMLIGLAILLFVVDLFPPFTKGASPNSPTATAIPYKSPVARVTHTATVQSTTGAQQTPTAIAKNLIALDSNPIAIPLTITDAQALIKGTDDQAKQSIVRTIQTNNDLQGKTVALVIIYIGIIQTSQITDAQTLTTNIRSILEGLPAQNPPDKLFVQAVYRSVIYQGTINTTTGDTLGDATNNLSKVDLRIYVYKSVSS